MTPDNLSFQKVRSGTLWAWQYGAWRSPAFPYLETRPWTPILVGGLPCFVASDTDDLDDPAAFDAALWCVVWGDTVGPWFDDVSNLRAQEGRPLYLARRAGPRYHAVWGDQISQAFTRQIRVEQVAAELLAVPLDARGTPADATPLIWQPVSAVVT